MLAVSGAALTKLLWLLLWLLLLLPHTRLAEEVSQRVRRSVCDFSLQCLYRLPRPGTLHTHLVLPLHTTHAHIITTLCIFHWLWLCPC